MGRIIGRRGRVAQAIRTVVRAAGANEGIEILLNRLAKTQSNAEFLSSLTKSLDA